MQQNCGFNASRCGSGGKDVDRWQFRKDGEFKVKSAYLWLTGSHDFQGDEGKLWQRLWKWREPERYKSFMWICMKDNSLRIEEGERCI